MKWDTMCLVHSANVPDASKPSINVTTRYNSGPQGMRVMMERPRIVVKGMTESKCQGLRSRAVFRIFSCSLLPSWVFPLIFFFFFFSFFFLKLIPSLCFLFLGSEWQVRKISRLKEVSLGKMRLTPFYFFLRAGPTKKTYPGFSSFIFLNQIARIKRHCTDYPTQAIPVLEVTHWVFLFVSRVQTWCSD